MPPKRPRKVKLPESDDESVVIISSSSSSSSSGDDEYDSTSSASIPPKRQSSGPVKRARTSTASTKLTPRATKGSITNKAVKKENQGEKGKGGIVDIEDVMSVRRAHKLGYHAVQGVGKVKEELLAWFENVREKRGMPWRKKYDPALSIEEKGQRAYEIWVSEVMLQQTQVATVIAYWQRWIEKWPTIGDLAKADIEEVNAAWRGLGYYRRARSLLAGAKTVMSNPKYKGRLPSDPAVMEKEIDGVGRYTAGAICSMAYGVRTPIVDGNIHRLLTRLLAIHAPQTAPSTIKFLWSAAEDLVDLLPREEGRKGIAGDWNQALMELGSQVCKPVSPDCGGCPVKSACKAFSELSGCPNDDSDQCTLCAPIPSASETDRIPSVAVFPMRKEKKASREEEEVVCVTEHKAEDGTRRWLFIKRPEKGLLAGLFEPPTTPLSGSSSPQDRLDAALSSLSTYLDLTPENLHTSVSSHREIGKIPHVFSHINMTYHIHHLVLSTPKVPTISPAVGADRPVVWLDEGGTECANVGTGVKKVWAEVYGAWGKFEIMKVGVGKGVGKSVKAQGRALALGAKKTAKAPSVSATLTATATSTSVGGRIVKRVMMPMMPAMPAAPAKQVVKEE